jgi:DNA polymerase I-like protein with 3'-5' exonuclease and polymerase domains
MQIRFSEVDLIRWNYNIKDICYTLMVENAQSTQLEKEPTKLQNYYNFKQREFNPELLSIMANGVKIDLEKKAELDRKLSELLKIAEEKICYVVGEKFNPKSSIQIKKLFKDLLGIKPIKNRKSGTETFGSDAMIVYKVKYPLYAPLIQLILEYRSIQVFLNTFVRVKLDPDGYLRTNYNVAGTATERLASRKTIFKRGTNLQNIPSGGKIPLFYAFQEVDELEIDAEIAIDKEDIAADAIFELPNCKEMFIPEADEIFFDFDFSAADARIVSYNSKCKFLIDFFENNGGDLYAFIASHYYGEEITKKDRRRQIFKAIVHGTNYAGGPDTLAAKEGLSIKQVMEVQKFYFELCWEVAEYIKQVESDIKTKKFLYNVWGARGMFLDHKDPMLLNKGLAWMGSSPVSVLINKILTNIAQNERKRNGDKIVLRLQTHDSGSGTFKKTDLTAVERIIEYAKIPVPYDVPRYIPIEIKKSEISYGNCK